MYNKDLEPEYDEIIEISKIIIPMGTYVDMNRHLCARLRIRGYGEIIINEKNQLVCGLEGIILAIESGQKEVKIKRNKNVSLKMKRHNGSRKILS